MERIYWVYILKCINGSYYTGYTTDLTRRYHEHVRGTSKCKYTKAFKPLYIAYAWKIQCHKGRAMQLEAWIKKMKKTQKEHLIRHPDQLRL